MELSELAAQVEEICRNEGAWHHYTDARRAARILALVRGEDHLLWEVPMRDGPRVYAITTAAEVPGWDAAPVPKYLIPQVTK